MALFLTPHLLVAALHRPLNRQHVVGLFSKRLTTPAARRRNALPASIFHADVDLSGGPFYGRRRQFAGGSEAPSRPWAISRSHKLDGGAARSRYSYAFAAQVVGLEKRVVVPSSRRAVPGTRSALVNCSPGPHEGGGLARRCRVLLVGDSGPSERSPTWFTMHV